MEEEKDDEECGDTPAGRLTHCLLRQTATQRPSANRRRQDSREYRCVCVHVECVSLRMIGFTRKMATSLKLYFFKTVCDN